MAIDGTEELPLAKLLKKAGIRLQRQAASKVPSLGIKPASEGNELRIATAYRGGPAEAAGLAAGDVLIAIDGLRVTPGNVERLLQRRQAGEKVEIHAFRRDELNVCQVRLEEPAMDSHRLVMMDGENVLRDDWLGA